MKIKPSIVLTFKVQHARTILKKLLVLNCFKGTRSSIAQEATKWTRLDIFNTLEAELNHVILSCSNPFYKILIKPHFL